MQDTSSERASLGNKVPRTKRGQATLRKLLDAAAKEFGERGFHDTSVSEITRRAGMALGSFYTYFDSKDAIFRALVQDMSDAVKIAARDAIDLQASALRIERSALEAFLRFAGEHQEVYRIIDEAEFVDPASYRNHYETIAQRIATRLHAGAAAGELADGLGEVHAWAVMGMNVFLGLRYAIWAQPGDPGPSAIAQLANDMLARGIAGGMDQIPVSD